MPIQCFTYWCFMGGKVNNYQVVYRGETLPCFIDGGWVLFQREKAYGGGWWCGKTFGDCYWFAFNSPVSLRQGLLYIVHYEAMEARGQYFDDVSQFELTGVAPSTPAVSGQSLRN